MNAQRLSFTAVLLLIAYFALAPLVVLFAGSLRSAPPGEPGVWTLRYYLQLYASPRFYHELALSAAYAVLASLISFACGAYLAWLVERTNAPLRRAMGLLVYLPAFVPTVLVTLSWTMLLAPRSGLLNVWLASTFGLPRDLINIYSFGGMVWVTGMIDVPLVYLWLSPAFRYLDASLEEAATLCGSGGFATLLRISLPLARPYLLAAWLIAFVTAIEDLSVPVFIGVPGHVIVLSSEIWLDTQQVPSA